MALEMAREWEELAYARDENKDTALHLLALNQNPLDSCCHCSEIKDPIQINPGKFLRSLIIRKIQTSGLNYLFICRASRLYLALLHFFYYKKPIFYIADMKKHVMFQLVNFLWKTILRHKDHSEAFRIISVPSQLLFDAAEVGNFGFLSELISAYPSMIIWEVDNKNQSIIHTAVSYRHASIFNLVQEIGSIKEILISYFVKENNPLCFQPKNKNNTLLHLAAKLAPPDRLELVSGAAFQMCLEIIWFKVTPLFH